MVQHRRTWQVLHSDDARSKALKKAKPQAEATAEADPCSAWIYTFDTDLYSINAHNPIISHSSFIKHPGVVPNHFIPIPIPPWQPMPGAAGAVAAAALESLPAQPCTWAMSNQQHGIDFVGVSWGYGTNKMIWLRHKLGDTLKRQLELGFATLVSTFGLWGA